MKETTVLTLSGVSDAWSTIFDCSIIFQLL